MSTFNFVNFAAASKYNATLRGAMQTTERIILAIESSCDDTAAAVLRNTTVLSNIVAGQKVHEQYGGVVPELASRAHQQNIVPTVDTALKTAGVELKEVDGIAFTAGPGLMGSLHVGVSFAKSLSLAVKIPLIEVHHMRAHIMAHFVDDPRQSKPQFPFLCLTVSGGHTQIVRVDSPYQMEIIGQTIDDAAGEAFDKAAKVLGLPYPGGPLIDRHAANGDPFRFEFPHPKIPGLDYSFSGLKTSLLYFLRDEKAKNESFIAENMDDICASYQQTIISFLLSKLKRAARETGIKEVAIAGGVSANSQLRRDLKMLEETLGWKTHIPVFEYCTDNAAMIGVVGYYKLLRNEWADLSVQPQPRLRFTNL